MESRVCAVCGGQTVGLPVAILAQLVYLCVGSIVLYAQPKASDPCFKMGVYLIESWRFDIWRSYYSGGAVRALRNLCHSDSDLAAIMPPRKTGAPCQICKENESKYACPAGGCLIN